MTTPPPLHTQAADMLERYGRVNGVMHCEVSMLIAELRAAAALDELVRENERLGLYDDQKPAENETRMIEVGPSFDALLTALDRASDKGYLPDAIAGEWEAFDYSPVHAAPAPAQPTSDAQPVAWRYRDYVSGCWFVSAEPYPAGSIAGESVPLYLAPAPAQPRQPLSAWIACSEQMPILSEGDDELPVYTWDGESVKADEFGFLFEQPAGPAVGGWVCIGADFLNNLSGTVTHWMPRNMPAAPIDRAITGEML